MKYRLPFVFWVETVLASVTALAALATGFLPDWIERVSYRNPDNHSGSVEWKLVAALSLAATLSTALALRDRRNASLVAERN
jgi:hypothetical protein